MNNQFTISPVLTISPATQDLLQALAALNKVYHHLFAYEGGMIEDRSPEEEDTIAAYAVSVIEKEYGKHFKAIREMLESRLLDEVRDSLNATKVMEI